MNPQIWGRNSDVSHSNAFRKKQGASWRRAGWPFRRGNGASYKEHFQLRFILGENCSLLKQSSFILSRLFLHAVCCPGCWQVPAGEISKERLGGGWVFWKFAPDVKKKQGWETLRAVRGAVEHDCHFPFPLILQGSSWWYLEPGLKWAMSQPWIALSPRFTASVFIPTRRLWVPVKCFKALLSWNCSTLMGHCCWHCVLFLWWGKGRREFPRVLQLKYLFY